MSAEPTKTDVEEAIERLTKELRYAAVAATPIFPLHLESVRTLLEAYSSREAEAGTLREACVRLVGATFNEMAVKGLPLECARVSTLGQALAALGVPNDERCRSANEWTALLEASLSTYVTKHEAEDVR